jgi:tRNA(Ser,Leu) C12 N-acetylase TAN1
VLQRLGKVVETPFYNVLLLQADDLPAFLTAADERLAADPRLARDVARILPLSHTFEVRDSTELERRFETIAAGWLDRLAGRAFHVRLHARGWGKELSRLAEERALDDVVLGALDARGTPGRIEFDRPDAVIDVEVVGQRAGVALWTREDLDRFPFLRID